MLLAIDGGNSKTDAVLLDDRGVFLERLQGPGSGGGPEHLASVVGRMLTASAAAHEAGGAGAVTACAAAVAGLDFDEDADLFRAALSRLLPAARVEAGNDAVAVLDASGGSGLAVIYGAGFNAVARGPLGLGTHPSIGWRTGEWGGGHELGREAVRIAYRSSDGRGPRSLLERSVLEATRQPDHRALALAIRDDRITDADVGRLAPVLIDAAAAGDQPAVEVLDRACREVEELALLVARAAFGSEIPDGTPALLAGGVFRSRHFTDRVSETLARHRFAPRRWAPDPVLGVVHEVARLAGVVPTGVPGLENTEEFA